MVKHNKKVETVPLPLDSPLHNSCVCIHAGVNKIHYFISIDHKFFFLILLQVTIHAHVL